MISRTEHPKPQFERKNWLNLNGEWDFYIDNESLINGTLPSASAFDMKINVPFCPQSRLSGVEHTDFLNSVWYKRKFSLTKDQCGGKVFLHFGAVDYIANIYINGKFCGSHKGGYVSFKLDISEFVNAGENTVYVNALDDERDAMIPCGKQSMKKESYLCYYTRTTGIWQTVWLEFAPESYIKNVKYYPSVEDSSLTVIADVCGSGEFCAETFFNGKETGKNKVYTDGGQVMLTVKLSEKHLWEIGKGGLYDLKLTFCDDEVKSYFGLRSIDYRDHKFFLNGKSVFQRLVLDQGFYPDGIYTAPSDSELSGDIDRALAMGFNGARLHEKVFEERFLYHADKKGYIVWGEYPNWGLDHTSKGAIYGILPEWLEEIDRDFNHPSIIGWCPFNETTDIDGRKQCDDLIRNVYYATKSADATRPCIDTSGYYHVETDIYDEHCYEQNPEKFRVYFDELEKTGTHHDTTGNPQFYAGKEPFFVSEYGGICWNYGVSDGWGYGDSPKSEEEFIERLKGLTDVLLENKYMFGFCYTQLTDVEQEQNGLYTYDRKPKFSADVISEIFSKKAKVEE